MEDAEIFREVSETLGRVSETLRRVSKTLGDDKDILRDATGKPCKL
jgi:hypothetical protein